ncbi:MAG: division/cell wall cluster transcriptional repressor MraZ [Bacteroidales bacterium]
MATFIGDYTCRVDAKGRVILPAAFKKQMPVAAMDRFVVKKDIFESCLVLYPMDEWDRQNSIIRSRINPYNKEHSKFLRGFYKGTAEVVLDASNRILIPRRLLDLVGIGNEVVLAGQDGKIEIWSRGSYDELTGEADDFAVLAEKIMGDADPNT